jgi:hypothetical protein
MRKLLPAIGLVLTACAATPEQMAQQSNWDVCRFTMGGPHSTVAEAERQRRGLDCAPLYPAIAARLQAENAAVGGLVRSTQAQPAANCVMMAMGGGVYTTNCR